MAGMVELNAWRNLVSYGAHLQPIRLQVLQNAEHRIVPSAALPILSQANQDSSIIKNEEPEAESSIDLSTVEESNEASPLLQNEISNVESTNETSNDTIIPPYVCEALNGGEQMALNVGGPVWAMDWLPSKPFNNAAALAAEILKRNQKRPQGSSASSKMAFEGKENNLADSINGTAGADSKLEWRYLALATHPPCHVEDGKVVKATPPDHYYDAPESARNLIQLWAIPVQWPKKVDTTLCKSAIVKPRLVYAIDHESGVGWDMQWCPLANKFPITKGRENILGILAVCFGDGTMKVFEIPVIPEKRLQIEPVNEEFELVERNIPIVIAKLPQIIQLCVHWSPHYWNLILTGGSDGSVALWNIKMAVNKCASEGNTPTELGFIEPQRRFHDADTVGKQEAFDWGSGWVAIRAVAWSPFDEHLFATTGNDSVFKVWDVREPRICLRSHRIRSTWGLALQWMDQTLIQISGDQGSIYTYDILCGSYQKLHFHPQIDSPVWDLQFARRGAVPVLVTVCSSGSIRVAPAKKLYRAPQNCVEMCLLSGEMDPSIEKPYKTLQVSFDKHVVSGSADSNGREPRKFCERDAALHRLRLSSITPGDYPCFLAAGGHAGLVILCEMQEMLDTLISTFFTPPTRNGGRYRKIFETHSGRHALKKKASKSIQASAATGNGIPELKTLGSFVKAKKMPTALSKYKKTALGNKTLTVKKRHANARKKSFIQDNKAVKANRDLDEEDDRNFRMIDEEEDESDVSIIMEDRSDDDCVTYSDKITEDEEELARGIDNAEEAQLAKKYQLDLSEEDAILLAIQMSIESTKAAHTAASDAADSGTLVDIKSKTNNNNHADTTSALPSTITTVSCGARPSSSNESAVLDSQTSKALTIKKALPVAAKGKRKPKQFSNTDSEVEIVAKRHSSTNQGDEQILNKPIEVIQTAAYDTKTTERSSITSKKVGPLPQQEKMTISGHQSECQGKASEAEACQAVKEQMMADKLTAVSAMTDEAQELAVHLENTKSKAEATTTKHKYPATVPRGGHNSQSDTMSTESYEDKEPVSATAGVLNETSQTEQENVTTTEDRRVLSNLALALEDSQSTYRKDGNEDVVEEIEPSFTGLANDSSNKRTNNRALIKGVKKKASTARGTRRSKMNQGRNESMGEAILLAMEMAEGPIDNVQYSAASAGSQKSSKRKGLTGIGEKTDIKKRKIDQQNSVDQQDIASDDVPVINDSKHPVDKQYAAFENVVASASAEEEVTVKSSSGTKSKAGGAARNSKSTTSRRRGKRRNSPAKGSIVSEDDALLMALLISKLEY
ncbi:hypothetical protein CCR75_004168 [Bremia lactucae]|uniref:Uncharacterized protein n=1 Tax=Bremia lactucae TaxID=4779 RepID=A0A976IE79_BRELC|nr:hypothetical protein CCR75_004168 [Bremia lactucae]